MKTKTLEERRRKGHHQAYEDQNLNESNKKRSSSRIGRNKKAKLANNKTVSFAFL